MAMTVPGMAFAQSSSLGALSTALCKALGLVSGTNSPLVAFVAGIAIVVFFVVLALNEGNSMVTWAIKILIGVAGLIAAGSILGYLFGIQFQSC